MSEGQISAKLKLPQHRHSQPQSATPAETHRDRYPTATEDKTEPPATGSCMPINKFS
ncbi:MAG: hypothetical protein GDA48_14600 [Hormoscilla sp. GM102CHS1]|nr:hypothetical protein [Hormoscilla sp. GM102CHS1]